MLEENKALVRRWFKQVWNEQNEAAIDEMFSPEGKARGFPQPDSVADLEEFKRQHQVFCGAFPDLNFKLEDIVAEGDMVAVRWRVEATHEGHHLGFPASHRKETLTGSSFLRIGQGRILEGWNQMDMAGLFQRLQA
jgi:predicted ester cyclase